MDHSCVPTFFDPKRTALLLHAYGQAFGALARTLRRARGHDPIVMAEWREAVEEARRCHLTRNWLRGAPRAASESRRRADRAEPADAVATKLLTRLTSACGADARSPHLNSAVWPAIARHLFEGMTPTYPADELIRAHIEAWLRGTSQGALVQTALAIIAERRLALMRDCDQRVLTL